VCQVLRDTGCDGYVTSEVLVSERGLPGLEMAARVAHEMQAVIVLASH
jgi:hypothetical protein